MLLSQGTSSTAAPSLSGLEGFAFTAQPRLLAALGRCTYAFMCLRWEALWLHDALASAPETPRDLAGADAAVVALRLQHAAAEGPVLGRLKRDLLQWAERFADCADVQAALEHAHPGADGLWSLPTDTPERLQLADRAEDLLEHAHRFESLALDGARLRRLLPG